MKQQFKIVNLCSWSNIHHVKHIPLYSNEEVRWMTMSESCRKDIEMADWVGREIAKNLKWRERELTSLKTSITY